MKPLRSSLYSLASLPICCGSVLHLGPGEGMALGGPLAAADLVANRAAIRIASTAFSALLAHFPARPSAGLLHPNPWTSDVENGAPGCHPQRNTVLAQQSRLTHFKE